MGTISFSNPPGQNFVVPQGSTATVPVPLTVTCTTASTTTTKVTWSLTSAPPSGVTLQFSTTNVVVTGSAYSASNALTIGSTTPLGTYTLTVTDNSTPQNSGSATYQVVNADTATLKNVILCSTNGNSTPTTPLFFVNQKHAPVALTHVPSVIAASVFDLGGDVYAPVVNGQTPVSYMNCALVNLSSSGFLQDVITKGGGSTTTITATITTIEVDTIVTP